MSIIHFMVQSTVASTESGLTAIRAVATPVVTLKALLQSLASRAWNWICRLCVGTGIWSGMDLHGISSNQKKDLRGIIMSIASTVIVSFLREAGMDLLSSYRL